jgi:tRNA U34 5-methylaminomethyl-2-thiouridine-forming methyltransferase MnmC
MSDPIQIITTGDGSHSLLNTQLNETYHSVHGAVRESQHVFIKNGLQYFYDYAHANTISIFEVGFGTGLNVFLTGLFQRPELKINYTSIEAFPLPGAIWTHLNYTSSPVEKKLFHDIHECSWNAPCSITDSLSLHKIQDALQHHVLSENAFDLVYFDAFAPSKQPEMWELPILKKIFESLKAGGVFVTYCAKGQLKRDLKTLGFDVETLKGPPGKKEMVRALKK